MHPALFEHYRENPNFSKTSDMKKLYSFSVVLALCFLAAGCSKDFLKRYEDRIDGGVWRLTDVDRQGFGGSISHLPFTGGQFTFYENGGLRYVNENGREYTGTWDIRREWRSDGDNDEQVKALHITAVDFAGQDIRSEYFHEMVFTGTDRFKAYIYSGFHTYVFRFRR